MNDVDSVPSLPGHGKPEPFVPFPERERAVGQLPVSLTSFVGREREIAAVVELLRRPGEPAGSRLVTLTGPGGVGKTRLAIRVAGELSAAYPDGVWFVPLAPVDDPALVAAAIAGVLGVRESGARTVAEGIRAFLRERRALLVLDNFEHLLDAGPLVAGLLATCPLVSVLVTSRSVLRISGEHDVAVAPLEVPNPRRPVSLVVLGQAGAIRLFVERARTASRDFALNDANAAAVTAICHRLDGLPLAIELAAARCRLLAPQALLTRLERRLPLLTDGPRDAPSRLRTMRDAIAWSYDLLPPAEQTLFRHLSVFAGGFTIEAAEAVGGEAARRPGRERLVSLAAWPPRRLAAYVFDGVASLVEATLLRLEETSDAEPRYLMLETIREFGLEQLARDGEEEDTRQRLGAWCLALAEQIEPNLAGPEQRQWSLRLEREHANLRAALAWLAARGEAEPALRLAGSLWVFWFLRGHLREGYESLQQVLALPGDPPPSDRVRVLWGAGMLAWVQGDFDRAEEIGWRARRLAEEHDLVFGLATALYLLFLTIDMQGRDAEALALGEEGVARMRASGVRPWLAYVLADVGERVAEAGDRARGEAWVQEGLALHREFGNKQGLGNKLSDLGLSSHEAGDVATATRHYAESLRQLWEGGDAWYLASPLEGLAAVAADTGRPEPAARLLGAAGALRERSGGTVWPDERARLERAATTARAALGADGYGRALAAGRVLPLDEVVVEATAVADSALDLAIPVAAPRDASDAGILTPREREVVRLLATGKTNPEIADALFISRGTVKTHVVNILGKLDARSRTEAVMIARRRGLL